MPKVSRAGLTFEKSLDQRKIFGANRACDRATPELKRGRHMGDASHMKFISRTHLCVQQHGVEKQVDERKVFCRDRAAENSPTEGRTSKASHHCAGSYSNPFRRGSDLQQCSGQPTRPFSVTQFRDTRETRRNPAKVRPPGVLWGGFTLLTGASRGR